MIQSDWQNWNPGLDNDGMRLQEVYDYMPELPPENYQLLSQLMNSPSNITVNLSIFDQGCLHIVLGRGLLAQDEAFVIGFTMGTAESLKEWETGIFQLVTKLCYPGTYQFTDNDVKAFKLGVELGIKSRVRNVYELDFRSKLNETLGEIREELRIDKKVLRNFYEAEQNIIPDSVASQRLV